MEHLYLSVEFEVVKLNDPDTIDMCRLTQLVSGAWIVEECATIEELCRV